jgi:predicted Mrr-cat superfamily restriction endonuclease
MKKLTLALMTASMLFLFSPDHLMAAKKSNNVSTSTTINATVNSAKTDAMSMRLEEIKSMDNSTLSSSEKKELRKETRSIKSEMKTDKKSAYIEGGHGGLYVSVGAAILIVLLLVLLL